MQKKKFFYGWFIVIGGFFIMATCYTIFVNCTSLFLVPITKDLNITRAQFGLCLSISAVVGIFASLVVGKLLDKYNARILGSISVACISLILLGWGFATQLWQLYVLSFFTGFFALAGTRLLISVLINNWFEKSRGLAISLAFMGSGVGGVLLSPLISWLISTTNWRIAYFVLAAITLVFSMPLTVLTFKNKPSDMGLKPYGSEDNIENVDNKGAIKKPTRNSPVLIDIGWKIVRKSSSFWVLILGFFFMGMVNGGVITNMSAQMIDSGHTVAFASIVLSAYMLVVIVGKIVLGVIYDRLGLMAGTIFGSITTILGTVMLLFSASTAGPFAFAVFFGFGTCLGTVAPPLMVISEFGTKDMGTLTGVVTAFEMLGVAFAAPMVGGIFDHFGSYALGWIILTVVGVLMLISLGISVKLSKKFVSRLTAELKSE